MPSYISDRRSLLKIFGAIGATCAYPFASDELLGQTAEHKHPKSAVEGGAPRYFGKEDFRTISRIAELIIPETETPGAIGAGVPEYIDLVIARNENQQQALVSDGLRWLDAEAARIAGTTFMELTEHQQLTILEPLCKQAHEHPTQARNVQFFALIKGLTADGYYTSKIGLIDELGYKGNMAMESFPGCIPEH